MQTPLSFYKEKRYGQIYIKADINSHTHGPSDHNSMFCFDTFCAV